MQAWSAVSAKGEIRTLLANYFVLFLFLKEHHTFETVKESLSALHLSKFIKQWNNRYRLQAIDSIIKETGQENVQKNKGKHEKSPGNEQVTVVPPSGVNIYLKYFRG